MESQEVHKVVRESYARVARKGSSCCTPDDTCCTEESKAERISRQIGYSEEELRSVPEGANLGLGCGNPVALASLKEGETVLDLGSGAGFDCFLAADRVGTSGHVIGVDMTPEMLERARENAKKGNYTNVEFRLGEIEHLPVADNSVDVVISNCVINLVPDKRQVFREAFRVLKPGGRMMISDIVLLAELPEFIRRSVEAYVGCIAGASLKEAYLEAIEAAGFQDVRVIEETPYTLESVLNDPTVQEIMKDLDISSEEAQKVAGTVVSIKVQGVKP